MTAKFNVFKYGSGEKVGQTELDASQVVKWMSRDGNAIVAGQILTDTQRYRLGINADHVVKFWRV